jgi:hypothetical protein
MMATLWQVCAHKVRAHMPEVVRPAHSLEWLAWGWWLCKHSAAMGDCSSEQMPSAEESRCAD